MVTAQRASVDHIHTEPPGLDAEIGHYVQRGYRVTAMTPTSASLVKPKRISLLMFVIWSMLALLPVILYLVYFARKKERVVYLWLDESGQVQKREGKG